MVICAFMILASKGKFSEKQPLLSPFSRGIHLTATVEVGEIIGIITIMRPQRQISKLLCTISVAYGGRKAWPVTTSMDEQELLLPRG